MPGVVLEAGGGEVTEGGIVGVGSMGATAGGSGEVADEDVAVGGAAGELIGAGCFVVPAEGTSLGDSLIGGCGRAASATFGAGVVTAATCCACGGISIACASQPMVSPATRATPPLAASREYCEAGEAGRLVGRGGGIVNREGGGGADLAAEIGGGGTGGGVTAGVLEKSAAAVVQSSIPSRQIRVALWIFPVWARPCSSRRECGPCVSFPST